MEHQWQPLSNPFLVETEHSFKKAVKLSKFHDSELKLAMDSGGDPDFTTLYNRYHPLHLTLQSKYNQWVADGGVQTSQTLNVKQLLLLMTAKVNSWDASVQTVYAIGTVRYKALFPHGHKPFNKGTFNTRIDAVDALSRAIGTDAPLATVKTEVDTYYTQLQDAVTVQQGSMGDTTHSSASLNNARIAAMQMQYADLGFLMNKYFETPEVIKMFFDVETLTNPEQTMFKGHLDPLENHPVLIHTFVADDELRIKSTGNADVTVYLASTQGGIDSTGITVTAKHERIIKASDFVITDYATHRYLTIVNISNTTETRFLIELY